MELLSNALAFGTLFVAGFILLFMLIQIFSYYLAGRITDSINDELFTAFAMFGAMLVISAASALTNALITLFLEGMLIPALAAFILYLIVVIYAVVRIYEHSIGKAILFLLLSFVISVTLTGGIGYLGIKLIPKGNIQTTKTIEDSMMMNTGESVDSETMEIDEEPDMMEESGEELMDEEMIEEEANGVTVTGGPSIPKLPERPAAPESTRDTCSLTMPCVNPDDLCLADICYSEDEIRAEFVIGPENCSAVTCENCHANRLDSLTLVLSENELLDICTECDYPYQGEPTRPCAEGYSCLGYKCVPQ